MCGQLLLFEALHFCNCSYLISKVRILCLFVGKFILLISVKISYPFLISISHFLIFLIYFFFWFTFFRYAVSWYYSQNYPPEVFYKTRFENFTEKCLCWSLFLLNFIGKGHQYRCFSGKSANECFCISSLDWLHKNIFRWLLLFKAIFYLKFLFTTKFN